MPVDGTFPTATTQYEKRAIAQHIPIWDENVCIQCGQCSLVCPHAVIRMKIYDPAALEGAPASFVSVDTRGKDFFGHEDDPAGFARGLHRLRAVRGGLPGQE